MQAAVVYLVTNSINGDIYVGITSQTIEQRWRQHVDNSKKPKFYFHSAIAKYGFQNFSIQQIASCLNRETSGEVERAIIQRLRPEYNLTNGGEATRHRTMTPEVREKMRVAATGRVYSEEENRANSERKKKEIEERPEYKKVVLESLAKARANVNEENRIAAVSKSASERIWSDESRKKLSASCMGRKLPKEAVFKMRISKCKPVYCFESDTVYGCIDEAVVRTDLSYSKIKAMCTGEIDSYKGLTFFYVADVKGKIKDFPLERTE